MFSDWIWIATRARAKKLALALIALAVLAGGADAAVHGRAKRNPFSIRIARGGAHVAAGGVMRYKLVIDRHGPKRARGRSGTSRPRRGFAGVVTLTVGVLPRGVSVSFGPRRTRGSISVLTVRTSASTPARTYRLLVRGRSGRHQAKASLILVVSRPINPTAPSSSGAPDGSRPPAAVTPSPGPPFTLTYNLNGILTPGASLPVNATLTNPAAVELSVSSLAVSVSAVSAPNADAAHPCSVRDFAAVQFSGAYGFIVPASSTTSLAAIGLEPAQWPAVEMLDRPVNQDGCKGATLTLSYSANAAQAAA